MRCVFCIQDEVIHECLATPEKPLYDNDAGSADNLATYILQMKADFKDAGLDIPVSISDLAYGWQTAGNITAVADAVDFFMINNFPYFAFDAESGGNDTSWQDFITDIAYFESIAGGRPLLVTQVSHPLPTLPNAHIANVTCLLFRRVGRVMKTRGRQTAQLLSPQFLRKRPTGICWTAIARISSRRKI